MSTKVVNPETVARYAGELGIGRVCQAYGRMSASKFKRLWENAFGDIPIPEGLLIAANPTRTFQRIKP